MSVDVKHFVDINIKAHAPISAIGTRDTVVLFTEDVNTTSKVIQDINYLNYDQKVPATDFPNANAYLKIYFENGGVKAIVKTGIDIEDLGTEVAALDDNYICVAYAGDAGPAGDDSANFEEIKSVANSRSTIYGVKQKILFARSTSPTNTSKIAGLAIKYSSVHGAEMTIAAYLSQINVYAVDTVHDYMYTQEVLTPEDVTNDDYSKIINENMNVDIELAGATRNCGGNLSDGSDIVNSYVLILLHQTLTYKLIALLSQKLKNAAGISKIYAAMSQELSEYLTCGFLTTDKIWTDPDWNVTYNNESYNVIEKGTALTDGFLITILPFSSLTDQDKAERKTPPIYVVVATQYGIRKITITGEVI